MSKILITGGSGFVGFHLASKLVKGKNNEIVIADKNVSVDKDFKKILSVSKTGSSVKFVQIDLTDANAWKEVGKSFDEIYHLASINDFKQFNEIPNEVLRVGITSTLNLLDWMRTTNGNSNAKILYTSSNEVYLGAQDSFEKLPIPTAENVPFVIADTYNPRWSYAGQKMFNELLLIHYSKAFNIRMVIVRPHYLYGPKAGSHPMIPKIIDRVKNKIEPFVIMGGTDSRAYCYVSDAVEAMIACLQTKKTDGGTYNIGGSEETTIEKLNRTILSIMKWKPKNVELKPSPDGKINHSLADVSKIRKDTGWNAKTSLKDGLKKTIEWYK